jgi:oligopeptide/dipeptide ABC transporter ATP-binding protein
MNRGAVMSSVSSVMVNPKMAGPTPADDEKVLDVRCLTVGFRRSRHETVEVVRDVSFSIAPGRTLVLLGESGSGKTVTAKAALRLLGANSVVEGEVRVGGTNVLALSDKEMRRRRGVDMGLVPQDALGSLDPLRRIGAQIEEVLLAHRVVASKGAARAEVTELLAAVGIPDPVRVARSFPHELSGGMRQRCLIAIAISCKPQLLIADEPTTALDVTIQAQVLELLARLQSEMGMGLLMVTHDVGVARQIADQVAVMYAGRLVETGTAEQVLNRPAHPYTSGLLAAIPTPETRRGDLQAIAGRPPTPAELAEAGGCAFAARCPAATSQCRAVDPDAVEVEAGHAAACLLAGPARP